MKVIRDKRKTRAVQPFFIQPHSDAHQAALEAIHFWTESGDRFEQIVSLARLEQSYGNDDCYAGIDYYEHLDGSLVDDGFVAAYSSNGILEGVSSHSVRKSDYLDILRQFLALNGRPELAADVEALLRS